MFSPLSLSLFYSFGVAKNVNLFAVRVLDCGGSGSTAGVIAGIDWVTANHVKPAVANMSLGGGASATLDQAVRNSIAAGVTYALAAGNGDFFGTPIDACTRSPARTAEALTVGSTTISDAESSFSNYGTCVDILAPGSSITSAWYTSDVATNTISGTSMATPHVAGAAALYLQGTPTATPAAVATALKSNGTANTITLHSRSRDRGTPNLFLYTGFISAGPPPPPPPAPAAPSALAATAAGASQVNLSWVDNSTNEDNFRIERCTGAGCTAFVEVATVGANVTTFSNTGLAASTSFSYRVRARNVGGNSAYSNTASATTAAAAADAPPVARYTWTCSDQDCDFDATTSSDDKGISRFDWNFGDGRTDTGQRSNNEYDAPAFYTVTLKVTDTAGKTTTIGCRVKAGSDLAGPSSGTCAP